MTGKSCGSCKHGDFAGGGGLPGFCMWKPVKRPTAFIGMKADRVARDDGANCPCWADGGHDGGLQPLIEWIDGQEKKAVL